MSHELCRLVAMECKDNQNKAVAWLRASPGLASRVIATKMLIQDAAGRSFKKPI